MCSRKLNQVLSLIGRGFDYAVYVQSLGTELQIKMFMRHHLDENFKFPCQRIIRCRVRSDYLKLVKDAVIFIEAAQLGAEVLMDGEGLDGLRLHVQVPHFHRQIIPGGQDSFR